jgi:predicted nucleotidyltransferase
MIPVSAIQDTLDLLVKWAAEQTNIFALALVGSYSRGEATDESHIVIILITKHPQEYFHHTYWAEFFGEIKKCQIENWVMVIALRVGYKNG